tara:strand:- start:2424 stop:2999 length:576 start_codon:yes stop_codon:yes gene_type:complete
VKIEILQDELISGHGSGNYFKIGKHKFIITAGHVIYDASAVFILDSGEPVFLEVAYIDPYSDLAIMIPSRELFESKAVEYRNYKKQDILGKTVNYTGYPSDLPKTSFTGTVSYSGIGYAIIQSYAVPGSSGSIVFDNSGKVIGVVSAVKIGHYGLSIFPRLEENVVFVERMIEFNRKDIVEIIKLWGKNRN